MKLEFFTFYLTIDKAITTAKDLKPFFSQKEDEYYINNAEYLISKENQDNKYFWLYAESGKEIPYSEKVYDIKNKERQQNPRSRSQIELNQQLFFLYSTVSGILYLSNKSKKTWVEEYLRNRLNKDVTIKHLFKTADEFIEAVKSVSSLEFVAKDHLFSRDAPFASMVTHLNNAFGLGMASDFTIKLNYENVNLENFATPFKKMVGWKQQGKADSLICIGTDDKNAEVMFNIDTYAKKILIEACKDEEGLYDAVAVKNELLKSLENHHEKKP